MIILSAKKYLIGMAVLPLLLSCATLDHETYADQEEQPKKVVVSPAPAPVSTDVGKLIKVIPSADVLFDFDSANIKPGGIQLLDHFTKELQDIQNDLIITGYTDRIGPDDYNKKLSLRRAESVKMFLISKGIDPNRIVTEGKGKADPVSGNACAEHVERETLIDCLSPDRRVEITIAGKKINK